jgi:AraC family transcriptional regulator
MHAAFKYGSEAETQGASRIQVRRGDRCELLIPEVPVLSGAHAPWKGVLLESHAHGPQRAEHHQHLSHFLCLYLDDPTPVVWQSKSASESLVLAPGQIVLLSRGTEHEVSFPKPVKRVLLNLEPWLFHQAFDKNASEDEIELQNHWGLHDPQIEYIIRALEADLQAKHPSGSLFGESLISGLVVHLRKRYGVSRPRATKLTKGLQHGQLRRVLEYIDGNLDHDLGLAGLAATAGMSPHYFVELFKHSVGFSPYQYVIRKRIERARQLLKDFSISILEAGIRSGFSDHSHFTKVFRRLVGVTPTRYRREL